MPKAANLVYKKADGVTDQTLVLVKAAAGDNAPAMWRLEAGFTLPAAMPTVTLRSRSNGPGTARRTEIEATYPYTVVSTADQSVRVVSQVVIKGNSVLVPLNVPQSIVNEAIAMYQGFVASVMVRDTLRSGYAPT